MNVQERENAKKEHVCVIVDGKETTAQKKHARMDALVMALAI